MRYIVTLLFMFAATLAAAQTKTLPEKKVKTTTVSPESTTDLDQPTLKFNVEPDMDRKEVREPMKFKHDDKSGTAVAAESQEEEGYKAYPGYPKHQVAFDLLPTRVSSEWKFRGANFNYNSNSSQAFGVSYRYISSPHMNFSVDYSRYEVEKSAESTNVPGIGPVNVASSKVAVDNYGVASNFCRVIGKSFFQQWCWGVSLGVESYPLLDFSGATTLEMGKVQDIVAGLRFLYLHPVADRVLLRARAGYHYGTGAGNQGSLSNKGNNSLVAAGDLEWQLRDKHGLTFGAEYVNRNAKVEGTRGTEEVEWKSTIVTTALRAGYLYTF